MKPSTKKNAAPYRAVMIASALVVGTMTFSNASAVAVDPNIGLNPSSPLQGYDLGDGRYGTQVGVQSEQSLVEYEITSDMLFGTINSGNVEGFYYAAGNDASAQFLNIDEFAEFESDWVVPPEAAEEFRDDRIWDSLYAIHSDEVVFSNGTGGTNTMGIPARGIPDNPFDGPAEVPVPGTLALFAAGILGLGTLGGIRRRTGK